MSAAAVAAATAVESATSTTTAVEAAAAATTAMEASAATAVVSAADRGMVAATSISTATVASAAVSAAIAVASTIAVAAAVTVAAMVIATAIAVATAPAPAVPGTDAEEDSVIEPLGAVVAVGSAGVGRVVVVAPLTYGWACGVASANADAYRDLGLRRGSGDGEESEDCCDECEIFETAHGVAPDWPCLNVPGD